MAVTVSTFQKMKAEGRKISMLTAYDYTTARLVDEAGIDAILVGDSLGNVMLGLGSTVPVTMQDMVHHTAAVGARITEELRIPTIGIGAGPDCDGQVLVNQDMLGMFDDFTPKFVRRFAEAGALMRQAYREFDECVKDGAFPAPEHCY